MSATIGISRGRKLSLQAYSKTWSILAVIYSHRLIIK